LNVNGVSVVRQSEIYTAEPLVPVPSDCETDIAVWKLKKIQITRYSSNSSRNDSSRRWENSFQDP